MGEGECETVEVPKKGRHRKKQLYNSILQQMEFYFSDSNLSKDRFLSQLISENPYVDIAVFLNFNKIRKLNCTVEDIRKAVSKSDLIELSEDKEKICRKQPLKVKQNVDDCTIYVENIKADANHEWLTQIFSEFGTVVYVSIPKYKQNKGNKGFAFVEFDTENEAQNALSYFESINCKMPSNTNPEDLKSIATFEEKVPTKEETTDTDNTTGQSDNENSKKQKLSQENEQEKRKKEEKVSSKEETPATDNTTEHSDSKKRKLSQDDEQTEKKQKTDDSSCQDLESENEKNVETESAAEMENKKKKKSKKDKKRNHIKDLGLQILSKKEWKKMRNRYLDLQRKKMKEFKQYLHKQNSLKKLANNKLEKHKEESHQEINKNSETETPKLEFTPGVIVKLILPEPCTDPKKRKNEIKAMSSDIKYVDIPPSGIEEIYLRFANSESAKEFCQNDFPGERKLLENDEEKSYWNKIQNDRIVKFSKTAKKQRGRDKLLKKAERERAKHIRFDEGD